MYINLFNIMIPQTSKIRKRILGSSLSLPAHGRAGARATSSLAAHFAKRNTKFGGGGKARAGKNSFPPTPFLFARPSDWISEFAVRIFVKKSSDFNQKAPPIFRIRILGDYCLAPPLAGRGGKLVVYNSAVFVGQSSKLFRAKSK